MTPQIRVKAVMVVPKLCVLDVTGEVRSCE